MSYFTTYNTNIMKKNTLKMSKKIIFKQFKKNFQQKSIKFILIFLFFFVCFLKGFNFVAYYFSYSSFL